MVPWCVYLRLAADIPGPPETLQIFDVSREGMTLTWYPPEDDGGSQVTGYIVERKEVRADLCSQEFISGFLHELQPW